MEAYLIGKGGFFAGTFVINGLITDAFWNIVQSDVIPEVEEDTGDRNSDAGG